MLSKGCKPDNFESHNSPKLSFMNICGLQSNFVECESFLQSNSPDILALCETNLDDSIDSRNFSVTGYLPLIRRDLLHSVSYFFLRYQSPSLSLCMVFYSISFNIDEVLSINPTANVFVFGDFNIHHRDWLTYSSRTDRLVNFVIMFRMTLLRWLTFLLRSLTVTLTVLLFWIYFYLLTLVFVLQWIFPHWETLVMLLSQFPLTFHQTQHKMPRFIV